MSPYDPGTANVKVKVGGVDITANVSLIPTGERGLPGMTIVQEMGKAYDVLTLPVFNALSLGLGPWDEVIVSNTAETVRYFAGRLLNYRDMEFGPALDQIWTAADYTVEMGKSLITKSWEGQTDAQILADIRTYADPDLTAFDFSTYVTSQGTAPSFVAPKISDREALDKLAEMMGADWYIDYDKKLHWYAVSAADAPFSFSDAPNYATTFPYSGLQREGDGAGIVNRVTVMGGTYLSSDVTHEYAGDGQQVRFVVPHFYHAPSSGSAVVIDKNTGTDAVPVWDEQVIGIKYIDDDDAGVEVLFAYREKFFEFKTAPANLKRGWRVTARYEAPVRIRVRNDDSYDTYGRWFDDVYEDVNLDSREAAREVGRGILAEKAMERTAYSLTQNRPGLRAGTVITLVNSLRSISGAFMIRRLERNWVGGGWIEEKLDLGDYFPDLYMLMLKIARDAARKADFREDDVLSEMFDKAESITLASETATFDDSQRPYTWGSGGANDTEWEYGTWN